MQIVSDWAKNGLSPRDKIMHDLSVQVSDYFSFNPVTIYDTISDGQSLDLSYTPILDIQYPSNQRNTSGFQNNSNMFVSADTPQTYITFALSNLLPPKTLLNRTMNILTGPVGYCHVTYQTNALVDYKDRYRLPSNVNQGDWISDNAVTFFVSFFLFSVLFCFFSTRLI